ncbi:MAG TPA: sulfatase-like hydrolase/transferase, partial [Candidatus Hydrogenedentes bacterium]|nr:sulfatase-like hydrolase/transferase [Candidatus Hydrogenedentota bacterium]
RTMEGPWPLFSPADPHWGGPKFGENITDVPLGANPDAKAAYVRSLYTGEIEYLDSHVAKLLRTLDDLGLRDNTYIVFTSDHGEELWERGLYGHGHSLYDEQVRVPLIYAGPGLAPRTVEAPGSAIDIMPTLAELLGVKADETWHGQSIAPILIGREKWPEGRSCYVQATNYTAPEPLQLVVSGAHKLIYGTETQRIELYSLAEDAEERYNLAEERPDLAATLRAQLSKWSESFPSRSFVEKLDPSQEDILQQLRAAGYLGDR